MRECAAQLTRLAKQRGTVVIFVGHVTKDAIAGPRVLEHIVDTVLYFEGDPHGSFRLVRAIKNRFGAANELGVFGMTERGLKGVSNPSALFLSQHAEPVPGSAIVATVEGSRPLLVGSGARRPRAGRDAEALAVGLDNQRLALLLAVLHRHGGIDVGGYDVFVNAVGGVRINEPAADLAVLLAVSSSLRNRPLPVKSLVFGEVGLAGEVRPVQRGKIASRRLRKWAFGGCCCLASISHANPLMALRSFQSNAFRTPSTSWAGNSATRWRPSRPRQAILEADAAG